MSQHLLAPPVGTIDRDRAVDTVLARLGSARSAWNTADVRGEVEQHLARSGIVTDTAVRNELAEDLTARAVALCVPLLPRPGVPEHIRALTSQAVLEVERDLVGRLAIRGAEPGHDLARSDVAVTAGHSLDAGQAAAAAALAGQQALVVIEGAAGAGKTTLLAATGKHLTGQGHRLVVVTPTLKAAQAASAELGAAPRTETARGQQSHRGPGPVGSPLATHHREHADRQPADRSLRRLG